MSTPPKEPHTSDGENGEKPLRERLRNAHLAHEKNKKETIEAAASSQLDPEKISGKLQRKRSHEDLEAAESEPAHKSRNARKIKRSRENSPEDTVVEQSSKRRSDELERSEEPSTVDAAQSTAESLSANAATENGKSTDLNHSPKSKRSKVDDNTETPAEAPSDAKETIETTNQDTKPVVAKVPAGSGFANTSVASPFASLAASKSPSEQPQSSTSAFASSGFGALAGSSTSAFGALGQSKPLSSFASPATTPAPGEETTKPAPSAFGSKPLGTSAFAATGSSGFGSGSSGFGTRGNGFGSGFGGLGGSKLTSFASSGTPGVIGSSKTGIKAFGAPEDDENKSDNEDNDDDESKAKSPKPIEADEDKKDERFFEQEIETGEENETTQYTCRAKLYNFVDKKEWKERGLGVLRLNVLDSSSDSNSSSKARLVMRADGSHRVILNTPIQKGLKFGTVTGERPVNGYMYFMGSLDGQPKLELLQLKARQQFAVELWDRIAELQAEM